MCDFHTNGHGEQAERHATERREWFGRAEKNRAERFKHLHTKKPVYEGAPNLAAPIIDDLGPRPEKY